MSRSETKGLVILVIAIIGMCMIANSVSANTGTGHATIIHKTATVSNTPSHVSGESGLITNYEYSNVVPDYYVYATPLNRNKHL